MISFSQSVGELMRAVHYSSYLELTLSVLSRYISIYLLRNPTRNAGAVIQEEEEEEATHTNGEQV
jgi:hypothetical protein